MTTETIIPTTTEAPTLTDFTASEVLSLAADLIEQSGWIEGSMYQCKRGYCADGAIAQIAQANPEAGWLDDTFAAISPLTREAIQKLAVTINPSNADQPDEWVSSTVYLWNDAEDRTQADVVAMLRLAAAS